MRLSAPQGKICPNNKNLSGQRETPQITGRLEYGVLRVVQVHILDKGTSPDQTQLCYVQEHLSTSNKSRTRVICTRNT